MNFKEFITRKKSIVIIFTFEAILFILFFTLWIVYGDANNASRTKDVDISNAATIEHAISTALNDYVSAKNPVSSEASSSENPNMITSVTDENEIVNYIYANDILAAAKKDVTDKLSWEYQVYSNLPAQIVEDNDKIVFFVKKTDTDFFVKISGSIKEGFEVQVKPAKEDPFSKER
ncbi:MAG: hypothetical protein HFI34_04260 [Lachnospiraceae bacterium]|nr:hypothetical protein [Lachnospiraceae bacterium]